MSVPRKERLAQILELRARGLTQLQIAEELGVARSTVNNLLNDPEGLKRKARRERWAGVCIDCGGPTFADSPHEASMRCRWCAQGKPRPMSAQPRLRIPIRLLDIPLEVRLDGVRSATQIEKDPVERVSILLAALEPSAQTYWVSESALPLIESWAV
jgi:transcriptional regulator with XRE-family HTH domain